MACISLVVRWTNQRCPQVTVGLRLGAYFKHGTGLQYLNKDLCMYVGVASLDVAAPDDRSSLLHRAKLCDTFEMMVTMATLSIL